MLKQLKARKVTSKKALGFRLVTLSALLGGCLLASATPAKAWSNACEGTSSWPAGKLGTTGSGVTSFGGSGSYGLPGRGNCMISTGVMQADHAQGQGPNVGPANSSDFSNAWSLKIKFPSTYNATKVQQVFFQVFLGWGSWSTGFYAPVIMVMRDEFGKVRAKIIRNPGTSSETIEFYEIGVAPMDTWLDFKLEARFTNQSSTGYIKGGIVPVGSTLVLKPAKAIGMLYLRDNRNADVSISFFGNYTWPKGVANNDFVATTNIDDIWQQYANWGY